MCVCVCPGKQFKAIQFNTETVKAKKVFIIHTKQLTENK